MVGNMWAKHGKDGVFNNFSNGRWDRMCQIMMTLPSKKEKKKNRENK